MRHFQIGGEDVITTIPFKNLTEHACNCELPVPKDVFSPPSKTYVSVENFKKEKNLENTLRDYIAMHRRVISGQEKGKFVVYEVGAGLGKSK